MKKIIIFVLVALLSMPVFAQPVTVVEKMKVSKKVQGKDLKAAIRMFMEIEGSDQIDDNKYNGVWNKYARHGLIKEKYSYDYEVSFSILDNKTIEATYNILSVKGEQTICDRTQEVSPFDAAFGKFIEKVKDDCKDQIGRLDDYFDSGFTDYKPKSEEPFYSLNYIIDYEDKSISYFNVIKSDRNLSKNELYNIVERYFTYAYNSGKSVIQSRDKENCVIVGKGLYSKIHIYNGATTEIYDVYHILRIDCRDGRIRVTFTINDYNIFREGKVVKYVVIKSKDFSRYPTDYRPFGTEKDEEMDECLEKLERRIVAQFEEIKKCINDGLTPVDNLDNW